MMMKAQCRETYRGDITARELGADTTLTEEFLKMGVDELSVSAGKVLAVRKVIRETRIS